MDYSTEDIRRFIGSAFTDHDLDVFCFDRFRDVHDNFAAGQTKGQKIQALLVYCETRNVWPDLMIGLRKKRPNQFAKAFPSKAGETSLPQPPGLPDPGNTPPQSGSTPSTWKERWKSFDYKWAIAILIATAACVAAWLVVPQVQQWINPDKPTPTSTPVVIPTSTPTPSATATATPTATLTPVSAELKLDNVWVDDADNFRVSLSGSPQDYRLSARRIGLTIGERQPDGLYYRPGPVWPKTNLLLTADANPDTIYCVELRSGDGTARLDMGWYQTGNGSKPYTGTFHHDGTCPIDAWLTTPIPPTLTATIIPTPDPCVCREQTDEASVRCLIMSESQAANKNDLSLIEGIFAPDAYIADRQAKTVWPNPKAHYEVDFKAKQYTNATHYGEIITVTGQIAWATSGSAGYVRLQGETVASAYGNRPPSDHWTFGKNDLGCWVITRFEFNAAHIPFAPTSQTQELTPTKKP